MSTKLALDMWLFCSQTKFSAARYPRAQVLQVSNIELMNNKSGILEIINSAILTLISWK